MFDLSRDYFHFVLKNCCMCVKHWVPSSSFVRYISVRVYKWNATVRMVGFYNSLWMYKNQKSLNLL